MYYNNITILIKGFKMKLFTKSGELTVSFAKKVNEALEPYNTYMVYNFVKFSDSELLVPAINKSTKEKVQVTLDKESANNGVAKVLRLNIGGW